MTQRALITTLLLAAVSVQAFLGGIGVPSVLLCFGHQHAQPACVAAHGHDQEESQAACACSHAHAHTHHHPHPPARLLDALPVPHDPDDHDHPHERCTDIELTVADLTSLPRHDQADATDLAQPMVPVAVLSAGWVTPAHVATPVPTPPRRPPIHPSVGTVRAVRIQI